MEDLITPLSDDIPTCGGDSNETSDQLSILPPADLNDLDEFPPLHHAAS